MPKPFNAIPGPRGLPLLGSALDYSRFGRYSFERMHLAKKENVARYGKIYKEKIGRHFVQLFDPIDIERVYRSESKFPVRPVFPLPLVAFRRDKEPIGFGSLNGEGWWRIRQAVHRKMMHPNAALVYLPVQNNVADDLVQLIDARVRHDHRQHGERRPQPIDNLIDLLSKYAMEAFGSVCFNVRIGCLEPEIPVDSDTYRMIKAANDMFESVQKTTYSFPVFAVFRTALYEQFINASRTCYRIAKQYADEALQDHKSDDDDVKEDRSTNDSNNRSSIVRKKSDQPNFLKNLFEDNSELLTTDEIVRLTIDLFTAGIDSTANALCFCLYNLARNVDKQDRLHDELDSTLSPPPPPSLNDYSPPAVTADILGRLIYLKACVKESFRLNFPVEGGPARELEKDMVLSDYVVPKGTLVFLNYQVMCTFEEYFENADHFIPERWLRNDSSDTLRPPPPNFVMLPFGYGSRMCIGRRFAEQEIHLALIKILHRFRLRLPDVAPGTEPPPPLGMINRIFTMPDRPVQINFIPR